MDRNIIAWFITNVISDQRRALRELDDLIVEHVDVERNVERGTKQRLVQTSMSHHIRRQYRLLRLALRNRTNTVLDRDRLPENVVEVLYAHTADKKMILHTAAEVKSIVSITLESKITNVYLQASFRFG